MDRSGYGQTVGIRTLHDDGADIHHRDGLRIAAFAAPGIGVVWSPIAERVDPIDRVSVNGIWMEGAELHALWRWMNRMMGMQGPQERATHGAGSDTPHSGHLEQGPVDGEEASAGTNQRATGESPSEAVDQRLVPAEPEAHLRTVDERLIEKVETHLKEHPPRDFKEEKQTGSMELVSL